MDMGYARRIGHSDTYTRAEAFIRNPVHENYHIFFQGFTKTLSLNMSAACNSITKINKIPEMSYTHFRYFYFYAQRAL